MSRIEERFKQIRSQKGKALVAFITAGDPDLATTRELVMVLEQGGVDIVELGVPFSDPLADGPVIQASSQRSLKQGTSLRKIIQLVTDIRKESQLPIVLMSSFNPVYVYGQKPFAEDAVRAGVDGVIVPDLPPEEAGEFLEHARKSGLDTIFLLAPTSTPERIRMVAERSRGFIYYISLTGTTGMRNALSTGLKEKLQLIRGAADLPVLVGFGISGPQQASEAARVSDGVIIGSAIVSKIAEEADPVKRRESVARFVGEVRKALNEVESGA